MRTTYYTGESEAGFLRVCSLFADCADDTKDDDKSGFCGLGKTKKPKAVPGNCGCVVIDSEHNRVIIMDGNEPFVIPFIMTNGTYTVVDTQDFTNIRINKEEVF